MVDKEVQVQRRIGDRSTSDVVVRLRTHEGRDEWFYCHTEILVQKCKYFADRLSENWPTCQILDSRNCVEVYCQESDFNYHVSTLRLLYVITDGLVPDYWNGVRNAIGILQVSIKLCCQEIFRACVNYLEAVPWEEAEEEEILKSIPNLGSEDAQSILARLQPVDPIAIRGIFLSAIRFATSSPPQSMNDLKCSAQEQLEYMLTEDDDVPLLTVDDEIQSEVKGCMKNLLTRFYDLVQSLLCEPKELVHGAGKILILQSLLSDLAWACRILSKMESMMEFVQSWVGSSEKIIKAIEDASPNEDILETKLKVIEVAVKVLEAIAYGNVILPAAKRLQVVKVWLPFVRGTKPLFDSIGNNGEDIPPITVDGELWQSLESAFVSIILALPSGDQAEILSEWLGCEYIQYPDLTEAFEVWCYRSKVAKRRFTLLGDIHGITNSSMTLS